MAQLLLQRILETLKLMVLLWVVAPVHAALLVRPLRSTFDISARSQLADAALLLRRLKRLKSLLNSCLGTALALRLLRLLQFN